MSTKRGVFVDRTAIHSSRTARFTADRISIVFFRIPPFCIARKKVTNREMRMISASHHPAKTSHMAIGSIRKQHNIRNKPIQGRLYPMTVSLLTGSSGFASLVSENFLRLTVLQ